MKLEISDVEKVVLDLYMYFIQNPTHKLPLRYVGLLVKILEIQFDGHPVIYYNDIKNIMAAKLPPKPWEADKSEKH